MKEKIMLGVNQYGKAEVRVVKVTRDSARHEIDDLNVTSQLRGDFRAVHEEGDNAHCLPTDTQKNTIYAFARDGIRSPEAFLLRLGRHFTGNYEVVSGGHWSAEQYQWQRIAAHGAEHDHAFVRHGQETRTACVTIDEGACWVVAGLTDLVVLKSTGSEFHGFMEDRYTTLKGASDRILATSVTARWRYNRLDIDFNEVYHDVKRLMLEAFATTHSLALQQTLYAMGKQVLEAHPEIDEIRFSMPNKHHFTVDLSPFGLDNPNEVFFAADRPYGLIEASVLRENSAPAGKAWESVTGFC
ncbi:factor-independent urate hydroxylase [Nissabacter sp. SGAir0207]|uniref:factor-independent urate hydroxylase n=1 Tax=Nissabacter sp. SGAir0207 TaxID=2126321 RepID=UPI0010CD4ED0|nr:urate oxidase [Nissabacter sp. SGAir0207]QCR36989.1 urate oxidase [Nissabacter sp. SGAir0207]